MTLSTRLAPGIGGLLVAVACLAGCPSSTEDVAAPGAHAGATSGGATDGDPDPNVTTETEKDGSAPAHSSIAPSAVGGRPLGTVQDSPVACQRAGIGKRCHALTVSCPGMEALSATVEVTEPAGALGTVVLHGGGGGTELFDNGGFPQLLVGASYRVVNIRWAEPGWEEIQQGTKSIKAAACRPATVVKWAFDVVHKGSRTSGFCGQGQSGGSGAMSYALATYGMDAYLDYVAITQGPPFGRLDCGCSSSAPNCAVPPLCPQIPAPPVDLPSKVAAWEGATCGPSTPAAELARLKADSVASDDGDFDYPKTQMTAWYCAQSPNGTTGGGAFFLDKLVRPATVYCSPTCAVESIYGGNAKLPDGTPVIAKMLDEIKEGCVPRH